MAVFDGHMIGSFRIGYSRIGVYKAFFDLLIRSGHTIEATRNKRIVVAAQHPTTGKPTVSYGADETINISLTLGRKALTVLRPGGLGTDERVVACVDPMFTGDKITFHSQTFTVDSPVQEYRTTKYGFMYRVAILRKTILEM